MSSVIACFLDQFGSYTEKGFFFYRSHLCDVCGRCVKVFTEIKELKTVLNFLYAVFYKSYASQFYQIVSNLISIRLF